MPESIVHDVLASHDASFEAAQTHFERLLEACNGDPARALGISLMVSELLLTICHTVDQKSEAPAEDKEIPRT
jgi:hypothetical protein